MTPAISWWWDNCKLRVVYGKLEFLRNGTDMTQMNGKVWPQPIDAAVDRLLEVVSPDNLETIRQMEKKDSISLHSA